MLTLRDVPPRPVPVAEPQTALEEVLRLLEEEPLHAVALVGDETYMGMVFANSLGDLVPPGVDPATVPIGPYVHTSRVIGHPEMTVEQALVLMQRKGQDIIPVVENNLYRGVVTRGDLEKRGTV